MCVGGIGDSRREMMMMMIDPQMNEWIQWVELVQKWTGALSFWSEREMSRTGVINEPEPKGKAYTFVNELGSRTRIACTLIMEFRVVEESLTFQIHKSTGISLVRMRVLNIRLRDFGSYSNKKTDGRLWSWVSVPSYRTLIPLVEGSLTLSRSWINHIFTSEWLG